LLFQQPSHEKKFILVVIDQEDLGSGPGSKQIWGGGDEEQRRTGECRFGWHRIGRRIRFVERGICFLRLRHGGPPTENSKGAKNRKARQKKQTVDDLKDIECKKRKATEVGTTAGVLNSCLRGKLSPLRIYSLFFRQAQVLDLVNVSILEQSWGFPRP
jgi:hypothetical protein